MHACACRLQPGKHCIVPWHGSGVRDRRGYLSISLGRARALQPCSELLPKCMPAVYRGRGGSGARSEMPGPYLPAGEVAGRELENEDTELVRRQQLGPNPPDWLQRQRQQQEEEEQKLRAMAAALQRGSKRRKELRNSKQRRRRSGSEGSSSGGGSSDNNADSDSDVHARRRHPRKEKRKKKEKKRKAKEKKAKRRD